MFCNPTSMIGPCQRGQKLSRRASEERGCNFFVILRRVCWTLGRGSAVRSAIAVASISENVTRFIRATLRAQEFRVCAREGLDLGRSLGSGSWKETRAGNGGHEAKSRPDSSATGGPKMPGRSCGWPPRFYDECEIFKTQRADRLGLLDLEDIGESNLPPELCLRVLEPRLRCHG
jgi:hypothetical protein